MLNTQPISDAQSSCSRVFSQPVQRFLVGAARVTFRAFPQAKTSSFGPNLSEVHGVDVFLPD